MGNLSHTQGNVDPYGLPGDGCKEWSSMATRKSAKGVVMPDPTAIEQLVNPDWPFKFQPARTTIQEDLAAVRALPCLVIQ